MDFCLHTSTLVQFIKEITTLVLSGFRYRVTIKRWTNKRSQAQNATWRMWMEETAKAMRARGVRTNITNSEGQVIASRPINKEDCHDLFVGAHGGHDDNGERVKTKLSDVGFMTFIMERHLAYCTEINIKLTIPRSSEFSQRVKEQHAT